MQDLIKKAMQDGIELRQQCRETLLKT